jgi:hypothetical protein
VKRKPILPVVSSPHARKYAVTRRVPFLPSDPEWVVFEGGSGSSADSVAHFFSESDARDYAKWREVQPSPRSQRP